MATRNYDLTARDTQAQKSNRSEFEELLAFIKTLSGGLDGRRSDEIERDSLTKVIETFQKISRVYYDRAEELILSDKDIHPLERSEKFYRVLDHLREHALLLADVIRFHPRGILSKDRSGFLKKAIKIISQRLNVERNKPLLLPLSTSSFEYFHFRYMEGFGLIGIPPEIALDKSNNEHLSVLWHEIAGHALAIVQETEDRQLESWATELGDILRKTGHWGKYRELYRQSVLQNLPEKNELEAFNILSEFEALYMGHILTDKVIDSDFEWQKLWLTEFLEDLFWILVPIDNEKDQEAVLQAMANALILRYPDPSIGDPRHPPMLLRLLVGAAYLNPNDSERIEEMIQPSYHSKNRRFDQKEWQIFQNIAQEIADFCRQFIITTENPILYGDAIKDAEKQLAKLVLDPNSTPKILKDVVESIAMADSFSLPESNDEKLINEIAAVHTIDELLMIRLVYTDPYGRGGDPPPPSHDHTHTDGHFHRHPHIHPHHL